MDLSRYLNFSVFRFQGGPSRRTVVLVVMAIILYQVTGIFYKGLTLQLIRMRPSPAAVAKAPAVPQILAETAEAYRGIAERNLFGTTTKTVADKQTTTAAQPDIATLVDLRGTVAGDARYGFAIIEEKGTKKQRLVKAGDVVAGAKVVLVKRNAMDLMVDDQPRTLKMVEMRESPLTPPAPSRAAVPPPAPASGSMVVNRAEIATALQDMGSMLRQAQVRPYFNSGVPDGFMVSNIRPGSLYQKMGIAEGDIIQGVNNQKIQTADDMMALYNTLKGSPSMSLTVKRKGTPETLNYQFQ